MPKFFDTTSGKEIPLDAVGSHFGSGKLGIQNNGEKVYVTDHNGVRYSTTDPSELGSMLAEGFRVESPEETQLATARREAADSPVLAGVEAAARGATLGLSTPLLDAALGDEYTENAALRREELGPVGGALEIGGAIAPAFLSGGALGYSPAGLLARGAESAGAAAERALISKGVGQGIARTLGMAAEGTLDGAVSSVGAELSEATLGDTEVTAERLLAAGGFGGLLGLAGGAGMGALGAAGKRGARAIADRRAARVLDDGVESIAPTEQIGGADAGWFELVPDSLINKAGLTSKDPEITKLAMRDKNFRSDILNKEEVTQGLNKEMRQALQDSLDTDHLVREVFAGQPKTHNVYNDVPNSKGRAGAAQSELMTIWGDYEKGLEDLFNGGLMSPVEHKRLTKEMDHTRREVQKAFGPDGHNAEAFLALENLKRVADDRRKKTAKGITGDLAQRETLPVIHKLSTDLGDQLRKHLENQDYWGEAGRKQMERNAAGHAAWQTGDSFNRQLVGRSGESLNEDYWDVEKRVIDGTKLDSFLQALTNPSKDFEVGQVKRHLESLDNLYTTLKRNNDIPENFNEAQFEAAHQGVKRVRTTFDDASSRLGRIGRYETVERAGAELGKLAAPVSEFGRWVGGGIGGAVGGFAGAGLGAALGGGIPKVLSLAANPDVLIKTVGRLEALSQRSNGVATTVRDRTSVAVRQLAKPKSERRVVAKATKAAVRVAVRDRAAERERARKVESRLTELSKDPMRVVDALAYQSKSVSDVAPATTAAYQRQSLKALEFLRSKLPAPSASPNRLQPQLNKSLWDSQTVDKFSRYLEILEDPTRAVTAMERGKLSEEHVEVLKAVYPSIYSEMRIAAAEEISKHGDELPYDSVVQLSLLLDIPGHPTMSPSFQQTLKEIREKASKDSESSNVPPSRQKPVSVPQSFTDRLAGGLQ